MNDQTSVEVRLQVTAQFVVTLPVNLVTEAKIAEDILQAVSAMTADKYYGFIRGWSIDAVQGDDFYLESCHE